MTRPRLGRERTQYVTMPICASGNADTAASIEQALGDVPGVTHVHVNLRTEMVYVQHEWERCDEGTLRTALERAGFGERQPQKLSRSGYRGREPPSTVVRLIAGLWRAIRRVRDAAPR